MRRVARVFAWTLAAMVLLVAVLGGAVMVAGNTDAGRGMIERLTSRLTAGMVKLNGLSGAFPTRLTLEQLQLVDRGGVWLTADRVSLTWSPLRLLEHRIQVDTLEAARLHIERAPLSDGHGGGGPVSFPTIEVGRATLNVVELGAPLAGKAASLSLQGSLRLRSLEDATAELAARRLDGDGEYTLRLQLDPAGMDAALAVHEPAGGPLENLLGLPGLGALAATLSVHGPRNAESIDLALGAGGLHATVTGTVDLAHASADVDYVLNAPSMAPRSDVSWGALTLAGNWHGTLSAPNATGRLQIDQLHVPGPTRIARLTATLAAAAGKLEVSAVAQALEIPGPEPRFLAADPLKVDASLLLDAPLRPVEFTAVHPLLSLRGKLDTVAGKTGELDATVEVKIPELAPYAVFTGQDVRGSALVNARVTHQPTNDALTLDGNLGLTGGKAAWLAGLGPRVTLQLAGSLSDARLMLDRLRLGARALTLTASGSAERTAPGGKPDERQGLARFARQMQARWQLDASDLGALSADLAGDLKVEGTLAGPPAALAAAAELSSHLSVRGSPQGFVTASLRARGLPGALSGTVEAGGMLDGAPLRLDAALDRSGADAFRLTVHRAEWKSAHIEGDLTSDAQLTQSRGQMSLSVAQLGDLDRLLGISVAGSVEGSVRFVPGHRQPQAEVRLDGRNLKIGQFAGNVHLQGTGVPDAFAVQLSAQVPDWSGLPAELAATAELNAAARSLRLDSAALAYHDQTLKLQAPAQLAFDKGVAVDDLKLGAQDATVELRGRISPELDLQASVRQVKPALINVFAPGLLAGGLVEARARLQGTLANPTGSVRLDATDIRFADDAATGLPPLTLHAGTQLDGQTATVDAKLDTGGASQLTASGTVPLNAGGALDLKLGGRLDVGLANPFLEARGMHATGELTTDATVTGTLADPQVGGGMSLAQGGFRDYGRGLSLTDISAEVVGSAGALQIKRFNAKAASGSMAMTGSFGVLQPGLPLDLKITAKNAQPIASSILTANLDADVHVSGTLRKRLDVDGSIHVNRAIIGIPDSLPPDVAVLDVRRRGRKVQAATEAQLVIGVNIAIVAPHQILVQGRGLDAEMGGEIHLSGTTAALLASGGLDLQRGSFTISGNKLTFSPDSKIGFDGAGLQKKIDPTLDFTAQTTIGATTATLRITGVADAPRFDFSSSPELPPDQIMALLLFGQPAAQLSALQVAQVGYALATLSGVGNGGSNPLVKLQKSLGLDRLTVGANQVNTATGGTENSGAAIAAGRYISKRVYIEGKQTTTGTSQVQVDVDLTKRLKLQTRLGNGTATVQGTTPDNDPGSSIGLLYQFEY
jgi:translocation and assembly module TamB